MDWEKRLRELNGYNISFEIKQGYYHIALVYDDNWNILTPDNESIYVEERDGVYHYIASIDNATIDELFGAIDATLEYNKDLQKKLILFKQKTEELQELFANEDYEKLQTIEFTFKKKTEAKKTARKPKAKSETKEKTVKKPRAKTKKEKKYNSVDEALAHEHENEGMLELTSSVAPNYDDEEVVTMNETYFQELERNNEIK